MNENGEQEDEAEAEVWPRQEGLLREPMGGLAQAKAVGERFDRLERKVDSLAEAVHELDEAVRLALVSRATPASPSKPVAAALSATKYGSIILAVMAIVAQAAAAFRPDLQGPLQTLIKLMGG